MFKNYFVSENQAKTGFVRQNQDPMQQDYLLKFWVIFFLFK